MSGAVLAVHHFAYTRLASAPNLQRIELSLIEPACFLLVLQLDLMRCTGLIERIKFRSSGISRIGQLRSVGSSYLTIG